MSSSQSSLSVQPTSTRTTCTCCACCYHIKRMWQDEAKSCWGKVSFILFYSFIWLQILWGIPTIITRNETGFDCYYENFDGLYAHQITTTLTKQNALLNIGVLIYAHVNGIRIWNIFMIVVLYAGYTYYLNGVMNLEEDNGKDLLSLPDGPTMCDVEFATTSWNVMIYMFVVWPLLALLCSILDRCTTSSSSSSSPVSNIVTSFLNQVIPIRFLNQSWQTGTNNSTYGKVSMILFYIFLWFNILWGIQNLFVGDSNGDAGFDCYYEKLGPYATLVSSTFSKQNFLFIVGFLIYAHCYCIQVWNVLLVTLQFVGYIYFMWDDVLYYDNNNNTKKKSTIEVVMTMDDDGPTCDDEFVIAARYMFIGMFIIWPIVTLILAIVDSNKSPTTSSSSGGRLQNDRGGVPIIGDGGGGGGVTEPDETTPLNTWEV